MELDNDLAELPEGWVRASLGEITEPSKEKVHPQEIDRMPYVSLGHIEKDTGQLLGFGHSDEVRSTKAVFRRGDLLYGKLRPYLNKVHVAGFDGVSSTDILVFPKNCYLSNQFLLYRFLFGDFVGYASRNVSGVQHPRVNFHTLSEFVVALPPLAEQHRIVAKIEELLSQLDAGVGALENARAQLQRYRQAVFKAATDGGLTKEWRETHKGELEPGSVLLERILKERRAKWEAEQLERMRAKGKVPKDDRWKMKYKQPALPDADMLPNLPAAWVPATVGQISEMIQYGTSEKANLDTSGIPVLRMGNIQDGKLDFRDLKYLPKEWPKLDDFVLQDGDVLFNRTNSAELVGKTAIYKASRPKAVFASYLIRVRTNDGCLPDFVVFYINSLYGRRHIASVVSQQVGQANVSGTKLSRMSIPLPPLAEQHRIVVEAEQRLSVADEMEEAVEQSLKRAERLRQSIFKRAFEGKLVPQDPTDEPASVLLERIKAEKVSRDTEEEDQKEETAEGDTTTVGANVR